MSDQGQPDYIQRPVDEAYARGINAMGSGPTPASLGMWLNAIAQAFGAAIPFRGGIGEPWRPQQYEVGELQKLYRLPPTNTQAQQGQFPRPSKMSFGDEVVANQAPGRVEPASMFSGHMPQFGDRFRPGGALDYAHPEHVHDDLYDMLLRYLWGTSRQ